MGVKKVLKKGIASGFNFKRWMGLEQVKQSGKAVSSFYSDLYGKDNMYAEETFDECVKKFELSEEGIKKRMATFFRVSLTCLIAAIIIFFYTIYIFLIGHYLSALVSISLVALLGAYAFRESFNYFQMKQRRLGCTFQEWLKFILKRSK